MDGTLRAGYTVVAKFGTGIWNQSGGLFNQNFGDFEIGDGGKPDQTGTAGPRNGIVNISGGILQTADSFAIGNRNGTGMVDIRGGALAITGNSGSTIYVGRMNWEGNPGAGGPVGLRVAGDQSTIVANGDFLMNTTGVASSSTLVAEITGSTHTTVRVAGSADITNGSWLLNSMALRRQAAIAGRLSKREPTSPVTLPPWTRWSLRVLRPDHPRRTERTWQSNR